MSHLLALAGRGAPFYRQGVSQNTNSFPRSLRFLLLDGKSKTEPHWCQQDRFKFDPPEVRGYNVLDASRTL